MKPLLKLSALLTSVTLCLCLTACSKSEKATLPDTDFPYSVKAVCDTSDSKEDYELCLTKDEQGVWQAEFSLPQSLEGMKVTQTADCYKTEYMGLTLTCDRGDIPADAVVSAIASALDHVASSSSAEATRQDGCIVASGQTELLSYTVTFDGDKPTELDISGERISLSVTLSDFEKL